MRALEGAYEQTRARIVDLVAALDDREASQVVPATPEWSVHDVVAHLAGLCADVLAGNVAGAATATWTQAQVDARQRATLTELLDEWDAVGPKIAAMADDFPGRYGPQLITDIACHEQDLRGALGKPGARDAEGIDIGVRFLMTTFVQPGAAALGVDPVVVRSDGHSWIVGTGEGPTQDPEDAIGTALLSDEAPEIPPRPPVGTLTVGAFELLRAISGRRSEAQIARYEWTADPRPYLPLFELAHFSMRETDLCE